ncbi:Hypothetical protein Nlim_0788 [Candidatus Nitrosarchaeum limnium SFB1]|jgi:hypothetical protein|uniref:Uncharacterized protein n=1 Tax=Candidatus Nitrosarchaeum limnium SFB1 TaxID=886738 RepID=F3KJX9_9ARCH|nr:Hypothetical protein Nlim_0788 [Candidatus Nitrosarchaeum limnium SFB1]
MKAYGLVFGMLLLYSTSMAYAHPDPLNVMVKNQDDIIIYQSDLVPSKKVNQQYLEPFTQEWIYFNFIWILASVIIAPLVIIGIMIYRDESSPKIHLS